MESVGLGGSDFTVGNLTKEKRVEHRTDEQREAAPRRGSRWEGWMEVPVKEALSQEGRMGRTGAYSPVEPRDTCLIICLILASGAAGQLPAHLPDTRQLSPATPARSSA